MPRVAFPAGPQLAAVLIPLLGCGPSAGTSSSPAPSGATVPGIATADLRSRLYAYADDSMQGRRSGTPGNLKATDFIAAEARRIGLEPAGEDGGWFQTVPIVFRTIAPASGLTVDGTTFKAWDDLLPRDQGRGTRSVDGARVIYGGVWDQDLITPEQAQGKLVVITVAPANGVPATIVNRAQATERFRTAAGVLVATLDAIDGSTRLDLQDAGAKLASGESPETPAFMYARAQVAEALLGAPLSTLRPGAEGRTVSGNVGFVDTPATSPARNVVAILRGSDPALRGQMVAIGAHNDHDGIGPETVDHDSLRAFNRVMRPEGANSTPGEPTADQAARIRAGLDSLRRERRPRLDSVLNGADDDGSGTVGVLEIAEWLAKRPARARALGALRVAHRGGDGTARLRLFHPASHRAARLDRRPAQHRHDRPRRRRATSPTAARLPPAHRLAPALHRAGRPGPAGELARGSCGFTVRLPVRRGRASRQLLLPERSLHVRPVRDPHRVLHHREPSGLPSAHRRAAVHRLRQDDAGDAADRRDVATAVADLDHRIVVDKPKPDPEAVCKQ